MSGQFFKRAKLLKQGKRPSQTPGKLKGASCQASSKDKFMAKASRSRHDPKYGEWCEKMDERNRSRMAKV